ncbi:arylsulfatase B isoform X1 [Anastrepha ludens]|uniref:arylsulfatase B isoform X1 n=1 Tax=Anastrepha ludens TaxID=28586 RepID=UPI0023B127FF|nr:arylsulfatase B isoform X1 [Anastrepha ludens]XP_053953484.1 arylsulfatase B isoform X1 [Anastrepha ludens]
MTNNSHTMHTNLWNSHQLWIVVLLTYSVFTDAQTNNRPNIVIILADDLGVDDISFRGSNQFLTPNIDALAYSGVILKNLYTPAMCTPSRSALLTGKYPIHTGMQHYVIKNEEPWGLPLDETTIAQIFKQHGYYTSLIGKWHQGMSSKTYTPTKRGFDRHFGYLGSHVDYYDQTQVPTPKNLSRGHDFRDNLAVSRQYIGSYVTDVLTEAATKLISEHDVTKQPLFLLLSQLAPHSGNEDDPLQAPSEEIEKFAYIKDNERRTYAAMVSKLDQSVASVIDALAQKNILNNTIIVFLSDNGGPTRGMHSTTASNYPLKGQKNSPWEGGIRSSGAIWSPLLENLGTVWKQQLYIADLLPTLAAAANIPLDTQQLKLDGLNLWSALKYGYDAVEREIVHNIDDIYNYVSYGKGKWKLINGTINNGLYDVWMGARNNASNDFDFDPRAAAYEEVIMNTTVWQQLAGGALVQRNVNITKLREEAAIYCLMANASQGVACEPLSEPCLFDIDVDPCEQNNLYPAMSGGKVVQELQKRVAHFRETAHAPNNKPLDMNSNPALHDGEWGCWEDADETDGVAARMPFSVRAVLWACALLIFTF